MEIAPLSPTVRKWAERIIGWPILIITAPVVAPLVGVVVASVWLEKKLDPPGWRKVFALWPVKCDPWPDDGYSGWIWLETVWRNPRAPGWTKYRREAPELEPA